MQKPLALSIAACLGLAGCNVFEKSETWSEAVRVRPGETTRDPDPSNAYAAKLHAVLAERGTEHKVVVYQYRYMTRHHEEAVGTRTAVIYRDNTNSHYPWWLKDDRLNNPFWLPNGDIDKQVSFYVRRKAQVIEVKEYPARGGSSKSALAFAKPRPALRPTTKPAPQVAVTRIAPVKKAPAPVVVRKPAPAPEIVKAPPVVKAPEVAHVTAIVKAPEAKKPAPRESADKAPVTKIKFPSFFSPQRLKEAESAPLPPVAAGNTGGTHFWSPPTVLDPDEQSTLTAPRDERLEKLFRTKHGSE